MTEKLDETTIEIEFLLYCDSYKTKSMSNQKYEPYEIIMSAPITLRAKRSLVNYLKKKKCKPELPLTEEDLENITKQKGIGEKTIIEIKEYLQFKENSPEEKELGPESFLSETEIEWGVKYAIVRYLKKSGDSITLKELALIDFEDLKLTASISKTKISRLASYCKKNGIIISL